MKLIHLISGPRNISTSMMYSFGNRDDCSIIDEPFYAYYLTQTGLQHPGREEVLASQKIDRSEILSDIFNTSYSTPLVFIKNMAHHILEGDETFITNFSNIFLIRHPKKVIHSFSKVIANLDINDIGIARQLVLYNYLKELKGEQIVIDSDLLLDDPESVLRQLCSRLNISFQKNMLCWTPGPREEDGVWAKYWYKNTHVSSGFKKIDSGEITLSKLNEELLQRTLPLYTELFERAIKPK